MTVKFLSAAMLLACALPALAEPMDGTGWLISCDDAGCRIDSGGFALWTTADSAPDAVAVLHGLADLSAVSFAGDLTNMSDANADLTLTKAAAVDDQNQGNLQLMQGDWAPKDEEGQYFIRIVGLEWQEWQDGGMQANFAMTVGDTCANGTTPGAGTVISLYRLGDDPDADGCWQIEGISEQDMDLRDFQGQAGQVAYRRTTP